MENTKYLEVSQERESAIARLNKRLRKMSQRDRLRVEEYANQLCETQGECLSLLNAAMSDRNFNELEEFSLQIVGSDRA